MYRCECLLVLLKFYEGFNKVVMMMFGSFNKN